MIVIMIMMVINRMSMFHFMPSTHRMLSYQMPLFMRHLPA